MKKSYIILLLFVLVLSFPVLAENGYFASGKNAYASGGEVVMNSSIDGDFYAMASNLRVDGSVGGDLVAMGSYIYLMKPVGDDVRLMGASVTVDSEVFGDALVMAGDAKFLNTSTIGGSIIGNAANIWIDGVVENNVNVRANRVFINGVIKGDASIDSPNVIFGEGALIKGDLTVREGVIVGESIVNGDVVRFSAQKEDTSVNVWSKLLSRAFFAVMIIITGLVMLVFAKGFTEKTISRISGRIWVSLLLGLAMLIVVPIIAVLLLFTVLLLPVAIILFIFYGLAFGLSLVFGAFVCGKAFFKLVLDKDASIGAELVIGSIVFALLLLIPWANYLLVLFFVLVGMGAISNILIFRKLQVKEKRQPSRVLKLEAPPSRRSAKRKKRR